MDELMTSQALITPETYDEQVVNMWVHGKSVHTKRAYLADAAQLFFFTGKSLRQITLGDLQAFDDSLAGKDTTRARTLHAVKSLFSFAYRIGYLQVNVGAVLKLQKTRDTLADRILSEEETIRMLALERNPRNHAILRLLYHCGLRVSELVALRWRDITVRENGQAQLTVFGKGKKTRYIVMSASMFTELKALHRHVRKLDDLLFTSRKGTKQPLQTRQVGRIVLAAARRAGIESNVSPHWLRHAHASHSLDRGAPIHLVKETLGHESIATTGKYSHVRPHESSGKFLAL